MSVPRLRAPTEHGQILAVPPLDQAGRLVEENHLALNSLTLPSFNKSMKDLRALARREILAAANEYHRAAGEGGLEGVDGGVPSPPAPLLGGEGRNSWIVAGHQPELFHPGVWFKNFTLHRLARQQGATALNLIVDTDTAKPALLHAPAEGRLARVAYDRTLPDMPYEERTVEDEQAFADLPSRLAPITASWPFEPMLPAFWAEIMKQTSRTPLLGERFAAARRAMERRWGCVQREVPMSRVCATEAFAIFAVAILERLPEFHAIYNQTVHEYRQAHGIRSRSHPVPDLSADGDWLEAPFWAWRTGGARRGKLMVRRTPDAWRLQVRGDDWPSIDCANAVASWRELEAHGYKVRSRALTTTMFARVFLADLFLHGIGGGIYDELTDRILERFFGITPPTFMIVSATLLLPLPRYLSAIQQTRELGRRLRDLAFKPERFVEHGPNVEPLLAAKKEWIERTGATHAERAERFEQIRAINGQLSAFVEPERERVRLALEECHHQTEWDAVAGRRDYAFCLYPEEMLRAFFTV